MGVLDEQVAIVTGGGTGIGRAAALMLAAEGVNRGTTLVCDGQDCTRLKRGDRVLIRRADRDLLLLENPHSRRWRALAEKLHWASTPRYQPKQ